MFITNGLFGDGCFNQGLLAVGHLHSILHLRIGRIVDAAVDVGVAAQDVCLFHHDNALRTILQGRNRSCKARAATANDNDIRFNLVRLAGDPLRLSVEAFNTSLGQGTLHGALDAIGGESRARQTVHRSRLRLYDALGHLLDSHGADVVGLCVAHHSDVGNRAALNGDIHIDVAVASERRAMIHAVRR